ncbi:MAG: CDP-6-deoxy-delta-3,4-glucoseen reductase, partial [Comamonas sp.]
TFLCHPDETLLAAAIRQGVGLPYACKDGACGSCKCRRLDGQVAMDSYQPRALSEAEAAEGQILTCRARPESDVVLESRQVTEAGGFPIKKMPTRVMSMARVSHDVMVVNMQLPANDTLGYHAGQFVEFILKDGSRRSYSMANAPHVQPEPGKPSIQLHLRHLPGGKFTDHVFNGMKEREILRIEGPYGSFFLREDSAAPIILLASGTGFAPIKAIIEHMQFKGIAREATLYWGGRRPGDLYMADWVEQKAQEMPNLRFVPVVSDALPEDGWRGRTGFVHQAVLDDHPDLSRHEVYACGAPIVVESARQSFVAQAGLPPDAFYADAFTSERDKQPAAD